ncbi:MAG: hypothetical protein ACRDTT_18870 [Pseudonocardiaceae bacterium]
MPEEWISQIERRRVAVEGWLAPRGDPCAVYGRLGDGRHHRPRDLDSYRRRKDQAMGKDKDDDKNRDKGGDKGGDKGSGRHGREDNTADADRRRQIPDRADPNKHDR